MAIYCAHCGVENSEASGYCKNCGRALSASKPSVRGSDPGFGDDAASPAGDSRSPAQSSTKSRTWTLVAVVAGLLAVIVFFATARIFLPSGTSDASEPKPTSTPRTAFAAPSPTSTPAPTPTPTLTPKPTIAAFTCSSNARLIQAIRGEDTETIEAFARLCPDHLNTEHREGFRHDETPLTLAVKGQATAIVQILVDAGANPNQSTQYGFRHDETPLTLAVKAQAAEMVRILIDAGADPNKSNQYGFRLYLSPLEIAIEEGYTETVNALTTGTVFSCSHESDNPTPLYRAVKKGNIEAIALFASLCPDHLNTEHSQGFRHDETPLSLAVKAQAVEIVRILIDAGVDPNQSTQYGFRHDETPLTLAVKAQAADMVRILIDAGADPNKSNQYGFRLYLSPLEIATAEGYTEIVKILTGGSS